MPSATALRRKNMRMGLSQRDPHFTVRQDTLRAITNFLTRSKKTWEYQQVLGPLAQRNMILLDWVPGHQGIGGNEQVDHLARTGLSRIFFGSEPLIGLSISKVKSSIKRWIHQELLKKLRNSSGMKLVSS